MTKSHQHIFLLNSCFSQTTDRDRSYAVLRGRAQYDSESRNSLARYLWNWIKRENWRDISRYVSRQGSRSGAQISETLDGWSAGL